MADIRTFRDLIAWQKGVHLSLENYRLTKRYPDEERFGLVAQTRRSAISIPSNIAEGFGREAPKDFLRFLKIARGSLFETDTQIEIAGRLEYVTEEQVERVREIVREEDRILQGLIQSVAKRT